MVECTFSFLFVLLMFEGGRGKQYRYLGVVVEFLHQYRLID